MIVSSITLAPAVEREVEDEEEVSDEEARRRVAAPAYPRGCTPTAVPPLAAAPATPLAGLGGLGSLIGQRGYPR
jgi:hypothetical protein